MSDKKQKVSEIATDAPEHEDEDLLEFKASMGVPSEVPEPSGKKTDEKPKGKGESMPKLSTKAGMINAVMQSMSKMNKEDIKTVYGKIFNEDVVNEEEETEKTSVREIKKISAEDIDVSKDIEAIFNGTDFVDEEFKERISTVYEAALVAKINEEIEKFATSAETEVEAVTSTAIQELTDKIDSYLDYIVEEWVEENKLAIDRGIRAEMVEDFLSGLKSLFEEHYVDIPEEKVEVVEELVGKVEELEKKLNEEIDRNVQLNKTIKVFEKEDAFSKATESLTDTQVEKLKNLAEGIEYTNAETFTKKINILKQQYFNAKIDEKVNHSEIVDDSKNPVSLSEEKVITGAMAGYMKAISKSTRK